MGTGSEFCVTELELSSRPELHDVQRLESREDIATLVDTFLRVKKSGIKNSEILAVKENLNKRYFFVIGNKRSLFGFDIVSFVDSRYPSRSVTNSNILLLFPSRISRLNLDKGSSGIVTGGIPNLVYMRENLLIKVPREGALVIGRSKQQANFQIRGNENVSRVHCVIKYNDITGCLEINDTSRNGTFVNGRNIGKGTCKLVVGDMISLAGEKFLVSES